MTKTAGLRCMMCALAVLVLSTPRAHAGEPPLPYLQQQGQYGQNEQMFRRAGSSDLSDVGNIALTAAGTIVAGLFGSQFGTLGTVVGGAAGLFVSRWIADKIFPTSSSHGCDYGQSYWGGGRTGWGQSQWGQSPYSQVPFGDKSMGGNVGSGNDLVTQQSLYPDDSFAKGSKWGNSCPASSSSQPGQSSDLKVLQQNFIRTYNDFKSAISSGDAAARDRTKALYDQAREAYYSAKNSSFH